MDVTLFNTLKASKSWRYEGCPLISYSSSNLPRYSSLTIRWVGINRYDVHFQSHMSYKDWIHRDLNLRMVNMIVSEWKAQREDIQKTGMFEY